MHRPLFACAVVGSVLSLAGGCLWLPAAAGPSVSWQAHFPPSTAEVLPVRFEDNRPGWERQYRALLTTPGAWRKAIGFLPLENIEPSPAAALRRIVREAAANLPPETTITLRLDSFRVILNDVERKRQQHEEALEEAAELQAPPGRFHFGLFVSSGIGFAPGAGVPGEGFVDRRLGGGQPPPRPDRGVHPLFMSDYQIVHGEREFFGPPRELTAEYAAGVTCEISARIELDAPGEAVRSFPVHVVQRVEPPPTTSAELAADVPAALAGAFERFAAEMRGLLGAAPLPDPVMPREASR